MKNRHAHPVTAVLNSKVIHVFVTKCPSWELVGCAKNDVKGREIILTTIKIKKNTQVANNAVINFDYKYQ
jgi:hypothetical protein